MLLSSESEEEYETKLEERKKIWSPAFTDYFEKNIEKDMERNVLWRAGKFGWRGGSETLYRTRASI